MLPPVSSASRGAQCTQHTLRENHRAQTRKALSSDIRFWSSGELVVVQIDPIAKHLRPIQLPEQGLSQMREQPGHTGSIAEAPRPNGENSAS